ncbi:MAG: gamma-glutamyltransferase family protein [Deltaproteobacteria bacterium]|nr:gamma-glutamyltransferase family protein [Deltaproteobacteria bacterium]
MALGMVVLAGCSARPRATPPEDRMAHGRSVVHARHGLVAAAHPLAVQIGLDVLKRGGNAVDAGIATNAALGFLEPVSCGVGGDLFAIVWDAGSRKLYGLNGSGRAPRALTADRVPPERDGTIPLFSPYSWTVPGAVDGWFTLHERFGRLPMSDVLSGAIAAASEGAPVPKVIAESWAISEHYFADKPGFAEVFLPHGHAPRESEVFANPALARTYRALAEGGRDAFYAGPIAASLVAFSKKVGGFFSEEDLATHHSDWVEPISTTYRGVEVWELPPNSQGLAALQMLNMLEPLDLKSLGRESPAFWHRLIETKKIVYEDRARLYADPGFAKVPVAGLLDRGYARERAALVDPARALERIDAGHPPLAMGDTTYLATADADGNMVSLIQSNYTGFGSGYVLAEWGFGLQDRGGQFNLTPGTPNFLEPGKRPFHTIIPAFATRGGEPWLAFGVMGGDMQPQGHVQVLVNLLDFGMDLQQAGDAPRFYHTGSSEPTGTLMTTGGRLALEPGVPESVKKALEKLGHDVVDMPTGFFGGYQAIARDPVTGVLSGATESRKDGCAAGY